MTLGSLWQLLARGTKGWMAGGTLSVLIGVAAGLLAVYGFLADGKSELWLLLASLVFSLGGGYAVLFPGISVSRSRLQVFRGWRGHPPAGRFLWILSTATAIIGIVTCILSGRTSPSMPGLLVWLFMGPYLAFVGWASAVMGVAANVRAMERETAPDNAISG